MMARYAEYKESDVEWLGEIPAGWERLQVKRLFAIGRGRVISKEELDANGSYPVYSSQTKNSGILGYINTYDFDMTQITWTTDGANAGTVFLRTGKYNCTNVCGTLKPTTDRTSLSFCAYTIGVAALFYKRPDTNGAKIMNEEMAVIEFPLPPRPEQTAIAKFLDDKVSKIEALVGIKRRQIELLAERKQILIQNAVTQGLNPDAPMKESGVDWIGEIPAHWEVKRLKHLAFIRYGLGQPPRESENGLPLLRATNVERGKINSNNLIFVDESDVPKERNVFLSEGEIIVVRSGAYTGDSAIITAQYQGAVAGYDMVITSFAANNEFLALTLLSSYVLFGQIYLERMRTAQPHLNREELAEILILCPPVFEQSKISKYIEIESKKINTAITLKQNQIDKLTEYKTTLINAAVTGKIKVVGE